MNSSKSVNSVPKYYTTTSNAANLSGNISYNNINPNYASSLYSYNPSEEQSDDNSELVEDGRFFRNCIMFLSEVQLSTVLEDIKKSPITGDAYHNILESIIRCRHLSEDFIMDNIIEYFTANELKMILLKNHSADIYSNSYPKLVLWLEESKD